MTIRRSLVIAVCVAGAVGAAGGFEIRRRWPIEALEPVWGPMLRMVQGTHPAAWREFARADLPRFEPAGAVIDGTLYAIGGFWTPTAKVSARVDAIDLASGQWKRMHDMPVAVTHANAVVLDNVVWLAGGFEGDDPGKATARVWRWDPRSDTWSEGPALPSARGGGALVALGNILHYFGGFMADRNTDSPDHWQLEPGTTGWQPRAPLPRPRGHLGGVALNGKIYALSGNIGHDPLPLDVPFVDRYDPTTDQWETMTDLPFPASHTESATFTYDGHIITMGGRSRPDARENQDDVLAFNPQSGRWTHVRRLPTPLMGSLTALVGHEVTVGFGAVGGLVPNGLVWRAPLRGVWQAADPMPVALGEVAAGVIDGSLYLWGDGSSETLQYDLAAGTWSRHAAAARVSGTHHQAAEVFDRRLWLFGGLGDSRVPGIVQIYDPARREWQLGPTMPFASGSSASAVIGDRFYIAGGIVGDRTTDAAATLDPATMTWTPIAPMPRPRNHTASATDGERLFVFGGRGPGSGDANVVADGFDDVQIYDPRTNSWRVSDGTPGAPLPLPQARGGMGKAVWLDGEFWIIGGETEHGAGATSQHTYDRVDIYNPQTNTWRSGPPITTARHGIFPVAYEGQIYVAGGGDAAGASRTAVMEVLWPKK